MARALVLSGGGVRGIFQAGVIGRLAEGGGEGWSVFTGVSAGAINALLTAQGRVQEMEELWVRQAEEGLTAFRSRLDLGNHALRAVAPGLAVHADVENLDGLADNRELLEILEPFAAGLAARLERLGRHLRIGVLCLQTGESLWTDPTRHVPPAGIARLVLASTAIPLAFDPVELVLEHPGAHCSGRRCQFVGGHTLGVTPVAAAVAAAREAGIELEGIDVVLGSPLEPAGLHHEIHGLPDISLRVGEILGGELLRRDLDRFRQASAPAALGHELTTPEGKTSRHLLERPGAAVPGIEELRSLELRILRPTQESWRAFTGREDADLGVELPGELDRNGELLRLVHNYGRWLAAHPEFHNPAGDDGPR